MWQNFLYELEAKPKEAPIILSSYIHFSANLFSNESMPKGIKYVDARVKWIKGLLQENLHLGSWKQALAREEA